MMMGLQEAALVTGEPCWRFGISNVEDGVRAQLALSQILGAPPLRVSLLCHKKSLSLLGKIKLGRRKPSRNVRAVVT
jgi:hypothetical protein